MANGCSAGDGLARYTSYDECILETVANAPNSDAVNELRAACARQFTVTKNFDLEVGNGQNIYEFTVFNPSEDIVTGFSVDAGEVGNWEFRDWIQPGSWVDLQIPDRREEFRSFVEQGSVTARASRVILVGNSEE